MGAVAHDLHRRPARRRLRLLRPGRPERRGRADRAPRRALLRRAQPLPLRQRAPDDRALPARRRAGRSRRGRARRSSGSCWRESLDALERALGAQGHNVGFNLGKAAGAGIEDHLHLHVVPRWVGDVNFMPVLADVRVMPQYLSETRAALARGAGRPSIAGMTLDPSVFKAYDVRGIVPDELDADGAYRIVRAYVDEFEPRTHGDRPRHAADLAGALRGRHPGRARRRQRRRRDRPRRHRDAVLRRLRARLRRRPDRDRLAQPQAVQRHEDRAPRRAARWAATAASRRCATARWRATFRTPATPGKRGAARRAAGLRRALPRDRRRRRDRAAAGRARRRQRHGRAR